MSLVMGLPSERQCNRAPMAAVLVLALIAEARTGLSPRRQAPGHQQRASLAVIALYPLGMSPGAGPAGLPE